MGLILVYFLRLLACVSGRRVYIGFMNGLHGALGACDGVGNTAPLFLPFRNI